jgi:hypothetical protein
MHNSFVLPSILENVFEVQTASKSSLTKAHLKRRLEPLGMAEHAYIGRA